MKTTLISAETYPLLHKGWLKIQLDCGAINRTETMTNLNRSFQTAERPDQLANAEAELAVLNEEEFDVFCIGAADEQEALQDMYPLDEANYIFTEWFG